MGELPRFPGFQGVFDEIINLSLREIRVSHGDPNIAATHWAFSTYMEEIDGINYFDVERADFDLRQGVALIGNGAFVDRKLLIMQKARMKAIETMLARYGGYSEDRIVELKREASGIK